MDNQKVDVEKLITLEGDMSKQQEKNKSKLLVFADSFRLYKNYLCENGLQDRIDAVYVSDRRRLLGYDPAKVKIILLYIRPDNIEKWELYNEALNYSRR